MPGITTIHQPNFFPWLGYFHKLKQATTHYHFDHIQATRGKGWHSRVKILFKEKPRWLTIPIKKSGRSKQSYSDIIIDYSQDFKKSHFGILQQAYNDAPYYSEIMPFIEEIYSEEYKFLAELNIEIIESVSKNLNLDTNFERTTDIVNDNEYLVDLDGNELVLELAKYSSCETYISGTGCKDFIRPDSFERAGINFIFQEFDHPRYPQQTNGEFTPGLSIIDPLMNIGWNGVIDIL